jgi:protein-disulfide isomerase
VRSGLQSGVDGTPSLFIDGRRYGGERDLEGLAQAVRIPSAG